MTREERKYNVEYAIGINNVDEAYKSSDDYQELLGNYIDGVVSCDDIITELKLKYQRQG
jgi:hypothetical protein